MSTKKAKRRKSPRRKPGPPRKQQAQGPDKALEALELRKKGLSYPEIGAALGITHQAAHQRVQTALKYLREEVLEVAQEVRDLELERLDLLIKRALEIAASTDDDVAAKGITAALKVSASRRKLLGIDEPEKKEITGKNGAPLHPAKQIDLTQCTPEELEAMEVLARLRARLDPDPG